MTACACQGLLHLDGSIFRRRRQVLGWHGTDRKPPEALPVIFS